MEDEFQHVARVMIQEYGKRAERQAEYLLESAVEQDDSEGQRVWKLIADAIRQLQEKK